MCCIFFFLEPSTDQVPTRYRLPRRGDAARYPLDKFVRFLAAWAELGTIDPIVTVDRLSQIRHVCISSVSLQRIVEVSRDCRVKAVYMKSRMKS